ncbi:MAG: aminotransferase class I/II-fold pyridoxal phosphate-dependent enzyme [Spirochaetales bacterium]|nr:aminotransferase class I/II-fold pyridoxal phosphate-dependent enzyme [Spirochaetales bacterium]
MKYQKLFAGRIGGESFGRGESLYKFEKIKRARREAETVCPERPIIDLGIGEPDQGADPAVVEVLQKAAGDPANRGYTDNGIPGFQQAAAGYMHQVFGAAGLDPEAEVAHGIGSKSILALLPQAFINPGDAMLTTVPGYPIAAAQTKALGGEILPLPLKQENGYLPDLSLYSDTELARVKLLYINYPNNPTGAVATREFYQRVVEFARRHSLVVISDEAYAALVYDGEKPLSFMSVDGAKDVSVSVQSLSKAFNMTGWRLAFAAGNAQVIKAFREVKDQYDSGQFAAIQHAGIYCLAHPEITQAAVRKYSRRLDLLVDTLNYLGFEAVKPKGTFYLYVKVPKAVSSGERFTSAEEFSLHLLHRHGVSTVPWDDAGAYVRLSVTWTGEDEEVIGTLRERLHGEPFIF